MRSEKEMLDLILSTARADDRIRAVVLGGSRANPAAPRDPFQDFDIVYLVQDVSPFIDDPGWIQRFGELMILQKPEEMQDPPPSLESGFSYLMQFADGNRIDLRICPCTKPDRIFQDSLSVVLLDKDGLLAAVGPPGEKGYLPQPPTAKAYSDCVNEFWWCCPYAAKGLWRGEILYARYFLDQVLRGELMKMLAWYIGVETDFSVNPGKFGKYFQRYLDPDLWSLLERTYAGAAYEGTWEALFVMADLFRLAAVRVADHFGYRYHEDEDRNVRAHLQHVRALPRTAQAIY